MELKPPLNSFSGKNLTKKDLTLVHILTNDKNFLPGERNFLWPDGELLPLMRWTIRKKHGLLVGSKTVFNVAVMSS
ncbi:hypothetical protein JTE90_028136 [Oedothorax gibbosus]|uniref:Uncharacterized protein n=1 Tax=Oedothorax gibbosus TaxID=931172 RepID=A0AAV6VAW9_9ARAC|nr:hypothetical protein JTE90_028136 [Oedothorax gibbosus]